MDLPNQEAFDKKAEDPNYSEKEKIQPNALKLLPPKLPERQHCQVFSSSVTSTIMKVLLSKEFNNMLE